MRLIVSTCAPHYIGAATLRMLDGKRDPMQPNAAPFFVWRLAREIIGQRLGFAQQ